MNKNAIILLIIVILVIIGLVFAFRRDEPATETPIDQNPPVINTPIVPATTTPATTTRATSTPATSTPITAVLHNVSYTEAGFTPATLTIRQGDTVVFQNNSARGFWPASDEHPTHTIYPEFDPKRVVAAGESWSFKFDKKGTWKYHDHRAASLGGTVIVQ
jgi:plastocyanin